MQLATWPLLEISVDFGIQTLGRHATSFPRFVLKPPQYNIWSMIGAWLSVGLFVRKADQDEPVKKEESDEGEGGDGDGALGRADEDEVEDDESALLSTLCHQLETAFRQSARQLQVKDLLLTFDHDTVFGKRSGMLRGLIMTVPRFGLTILMPFVLHLCKVT